MPKPGPTWKLIHGDCREVLPTLADGSFDAVVTDPPAGISFMGANWDSFGGKSNGNAEQDRAAGNRGPGAGMGNQPFGYSGSAYPKAGERATFVAFLTAVMAECLRVARPGAYALVWALPRTSHWTGTALEDAGWVVTDVVTHLFGQGFPKHKSKLKPAAEFWYLCWKPDRRATPLPGLDQCRIETTDVYNRAPASSGFSSINGYEYGTGRQSDSSAAGRYPANLVLSHTDRCRPAGTRKVKGGNGVRGGGNTFSENTCGLRGRTGQEVGYAGPDGTEEVEAWECAGDCPVRMLDEQGGERASGSGRKSANRNTPFGGGGWKPDDREFAGDRGGASRFFYCPKASRKDRGEGNTHPTVKPHNLMRWLCRLVTPPGGRVLDPFAGSGSTLAAALAEGFAAVGIEQSAEYVEIARRRLLAPRDVVK